MSTHRAARRPILLSAFWCQSTRTCLINGGLHRGDSHDGVGMINLHGYKRRRSRIAQGVTHSRIKSIVPARPIMANIRRRRPLSDRVVVPPCDSSRCSATGAQSSPSMSSHVSAHAALPQRHGARSLKSMSATRRSAGRRERRVGHAESCTRERGFCIIQTRIIFGWMI